MNIILADGCLQPSLRKGWAMPPERIYKVGEVFGISRDLPVNYVLRRNIDDKLIDNLTRDHHVVIFGSSKQGKTCLRKSCLNNDDYIVVACMGSMDLKQLHAAILKSAGYEIAESSTRSSDGSFKLTAKFSAKVGAIIASGQAEGSGELARNHGEETTTRRLELDAQDPNDVIGALKEIEFKKFIVLEDFHYLPVETQQAFTHVLKAFHENSKITFIVVAVWREENRLILYNGDLTGRVVAIDADAWTVEQLQEVITAGEALLNISFSDTFKNELVNSAFLSVYLVQEGCHRACTDSGIYETRETYTEVVPLKTAKQHVSDIVSEQGGRYKSFLTNFAMGFQDTELEMFKWILYPILRSEISDLKIGLGYREIREKIQQKHPRGDKLNAGNITQALQSVGGLQSKKNVKPFVIDYDSTNLILSVVDTGFLIWLDSQNRAEVLDLIGLPNG
jgi:hypothetical protein